MEGGSVRHRARVVSLQPLFSSHTTIHLSFITFEPYVNFNRDIYDLQIVSRACAHCSTPLTERLLSSSSLVQRCPTTSSACPARFCNRLCLKRSEKTHPLLCPAQNPASVPLLAFARKQTWLALHALTRCTARLLLAHQQQGRQRAGGGGGESEGIDDDWRVYCAFADLGMEERAKGSWWVISRIISQHLRRRLILMSYMRVSQGYGVRSRTARLGRLHTRLSYRLSWSRQMRPGRKNSQRCYHSHLRRRSQMHSSRTRASFMGSGA